MTELADQVCEPCTKGTPPLSREEAGTLLKEIPEWTLEEKWIEREFKFAGFRQAIEFINRVADAAEKMDHHPDIYNSYNKVRIKLWTHKIDGLSRNDFVLAAKIDRLCEPK